ARASSAAAGGQEVGGASPQDGDARGGPNASGEEAAAIDGVGHRCPFCVDTCPVPKKCVRSVTVGPRRFQAGPRRPRFTRFSGRPAYQAVVDRFGPDVVSADGAIDRPALAAVVFADATAPADLEAITHPVVGATMAKRITAQAGTDRVVVLDVPLLVEGGRGRPAGRDAEGGRTGLPHGVAAVVVVDTPPELAVQRLVRDRGMK